MPRVPKMAMCIEISTECGALAAGGVPRDELNLIAHQERVDTPEAMAGWVSRVVAVPGVGPLLAIGPIAAALSGMAGEVA